MTIDLKDIYKNGTVQFSYYRKGSLYYSLFIDDENKLTFPVPITDTGDASFKAQDKASLFFRYIKAALEAK